MKWIETILRRLIQSDMETQPTPQVKIRSDVKAGVYVGFSVSAGIGNPANDAPQLDVRNTKVF